VLRPGEVPRTQLTVFRYLPATKAIPINIVIQFGRADVATAGDVGHARNVADSRVVALVDNRC